MILASIQHHSRTSSSDGLLAVVHPNHASLVLPPTSITGSSHEGLSLLRALDAWDHYFPILADIDVQLRAGQRSDTIAVSDVTFLAPLPRTWAFMDGSAFVQHIVLVRKARGAELPDDLYTIPLMYQGASDNLLCATEDIPLRDPADGMDFESEIGVITDCVPMGISASQAASHIKLLVLLNDISLRELIPRELATGFGFFHGKPPSSFAPLAITPDELGDAWHDGRVHLPVETTLNGKLFGRPLASEMHFSFYDLIAHAALTRPLSAGTIIGSGTVSNQDSSLGSSCIVERRMLEKINSGSIKTPYLQDGDEIHITVRQGSHDVFGAIHQRIRRKST